MSFEIINPASLGAPRGYQNGILATGGRTLYIAGQVGWDRDQRIVSDDFAEQFGQAVANVLAVVQEAGGGPANVASLTIYVTDLSRYTSSLKAVGEEYRKRMGWHFPAMTLVEVEGLLEEGAQVEIQGVAVLP